MSQKYIYPSLFQEEDPHESIPSEKTEYDLTNLFERLAKSDFRSRFHLSKKDREYVMEKGLPTIRKHAEDFVAKTCSGCHTERRQADSHAWASCFPGSTCHWLLLQGMLLQVASHPSRQGTDQGRTGICCCRIDGMD